MWGKNYLCCDFGMGIKAKCGGAQFIRVKVVLCSNHICSSKKKNRGQSIIERTILTYLFWKKREGRKIGLGQQC